MLEDEDDEFSREGSEPLLDDVMVVSVRGLK